MGSTKLGSCSGVEVLVGVLCQSFRMLKKRLLCALPTHPTTHTRPLARMHIAKLESRGSRGFREYPRGCRPSTTTRKPGLRLVFI